MVVTFGYQVAGLVLELIKGLAADIGEPIDKEASHQIRRKSYVNDGLEVGMRDQVNRFRGNLIDRQYTGTIPQILGLVNLNIKVMIASRDEDKEQLEILGHKVLGRTHVDLPMIDLSFGWHLT